MKSRWPQLLPPAFAPENQRPNGEKEGKEDTGKDCPGAGESYSVRKGEGEENYYEGKASRKVEEDSAFGGLWFVAVGHVRIECCGGDLETEYS